MAEVGRKIKKLREIVGKTQEEVAKALGVSKSTISKWEKGERTPSLGALEQICDLFQVNIDTLLSPREPEMAFRGARGEDKAKVQDVLTFWLDRIVDILGVVEESKVLSSLWSRELLPHFSIETFSDPQRMDIVVSEAEKMRAEIGKVLGDKVGNFSKTIERESNLFVFRLPLPSEVSGVSARYKEVSLILVSTLEPKERQKFTLCHEMAHLLFHIPSTGGAFVSFTPKGKRKPREEKEADAFAGRLLIPNDTLRILRKEKHHIVLELVKALGALTFVAPAAYLYRAFEEGFISEKTYGWCKKQLPPLEPGKGETVLSPKFEQMVLKALAIEEISLKEASVLLDQDYVSVKNRMEELVGRAAA
jgi:transcriptional regulator with XRE-family HTH domain/Zn-dependent peptidase ImmA (M78 family)